MSRGFQSKKQTPQIRLRYELKYIVLIE